MKISLYYQQNTAQIQRDTTPFPAVLVAVSDLRRLMHDILFLLTTHYSPLTTHCSLYFSCFLQRSLISPLRVSICVKKVFLGG